MNFAGEDHTNFQTLVAFLKMLGTLVCKAHYMIKFCWMPFLVSHNYTIYCYLDLCYEFPVRLLVQRVQQRFLSYFRERRSALLGGALCLIVYQFMKRSSNRPFKPQGPFCLSFKKGMQRRLLHI